MGLLLSSAIQCQGTSFTLWIRLWSALFRVDHDGPHTQNKLLLILLLLVFGCFLRTENHRYLVANGAEIMYDFLVVKTFACFSAGAEFSSGPIAEPAVRWTLGSSW